MTEHTPGPWNREREGFEDCIYDADGRIVAEVYRHRKEHEANARLIAAAPDLLVALERILDDCPHDGGGSNGWQDLACWWCGEEMEAHADDCPIALAQAAIAKAKID